MPNPFPGMDPYLEHPVLWPSLHQVFNTLLARTLSQVLPTRYVVRVAERVFIEMGELRPGSGRSSSATSWAAQPSPPMPSPTRAASERERRNGQQPAKGAFTSWYVAAVPEEIREGSVEVSLAGEPERLITSVELVSPAGKSPGRQGRRHYRQRQQQLLTIGAHILEVDLLRKGQHVLLAPWENVLQHGRFDYLISLCRANRRDCCEVWGVDLRQRLPRVALPLAEGDADLMLDVQNLLDHCYNARGFDRQIDYQSDPYYPLPRLDALWAETQAGSTQHHERRLAQSV
jgi:hypothetical protein